MRLHSKPRMRARERFTLLPNTDALGDEEATAGVTAPGRAEGITAVGRTEEATPEDEAAGAAKGRGAEAAWTAAATADVLNAAVAA